MKIKLTVTLLFFTCFALIISCNSNKNKEPKMKESKFKEEIVSYPLHSSTRNNFVVYDESLTGKIPVVFIIHEWWGINDYIRQRARQIASLGYFAVAIDMYGDNKYGPDPESAGALAAPFYDKPEIAKPIFEAALAKITSFTQADTSKMAAIGYCYGGAMVLNLARFGENLKGVVGFHGNLNVTQPEKGVLKAEILVCHGAADPYVKEEEVVKFKKQMDSIGAPYIVKEYPDAVHGFTNPAATEIGKKYNMAVAYDEKADKESWAEMKSFLSKIFNITKS
ncbi:MAG: dienelactone hydrolase family protein [Bacteroidetes bacterium]|nr:dienelactone hydrolase family protein [Bacteroidota bacterium]